jgi:hypothetical protein
VGQGELPFHERNTNSSSTATEPILKKIMLAQQIFVKKSYDGFHESATHD